MAAAPRLEPRSAGCPFDKLSDELVCLILRKAAVKTYLEGTCGLRVEDSNEIWVSARELNQLKTVCQRFGKLELQTTAGSHVVWEFSKGDTMVGANALLQTGAHTRGLVLHHKPGRVFEGKDLQGSVNIDLLVGILTRAPNLRKFVLSRSEKRQTQEAAKCLFTLLSQKPLSVLWLLESGFDFMEPLRQTVGFRCLTDVQIHSADISDVFLGSLLAQAPKLESLSLMHCKGLDKPVFEAPHLKVLALNLSESTGEVSKITVKAPELSRLDGLPGVRHLKLDAPNLKKLCLNGPIGSMEEPQRKFEVTDLTLNRDGWCLSEALEAVSIFGASQSLCFGMSSWHLDSDSEHVATFLSKLPSTLTSLTVGQATAMLYGLYDGEDLQNLRFEFLKEADLAVCEPEDFDMITLILGCCPKLERVTLDLDWIIKPIDGLVYRVMKLQKEFPGIEWECREPLQFVSSGLLREAAHSPQKLRTLVDEVCAFAE